MHGLSLAVLGDQGHLQTTLLCLLSAPKQASQCLSGNPLVCPPVLPLFRERTYSSLHTSWLGLCSAFPAQDPTGLSCSYLLFSGKFAIRADKKSNPIVRTVKSVGMIAGGTGKGWNPDGAVVGRSVGVGGGLW